MAFVIGVDDGAALGSDGAGEEPPPPPQAAGTALASTAQKKRVLDFNTRMIPLNAQLVDVRDFAALRADACAPYRLLTRRVHRANERQEAAAVTRPQRAGICAGPLLTSELVLRAV